MPSAIILEQKQAQVAAIANTMQGACTGVFVEYKGITVENDTRLRNELRAAGVQYHVFKNTLLNLAAKQVELDGLEPVLHGTTALATSEADYTAAARILSKYASGSKTFQIKAGFLDGKVIGLEKVEALAKLPSREVLLATVCNAFQAPIAAFARVLGAVAEQKAAAGADAA